MAQYKNKKTGNWYIKCRNPIDGKPTTIRRNSTTNLPFKTKKEAKEFEVSYLKSKIDLSMTLDQLVDMYINEYLALRPSPSNRSINSWYSNNIQPVLGKRKIVGLRVRDLEKLAKEMKASGYSVVYINKMTALIKTFLNFAVSHGYIETNPIINYKPLKQIKTSERIKYWTPEQFKIVINAIPLRYKKSNCDLIRFVLSFAYLSGLRKSEIRALKWNQIDLKNKILHVDYHINNNEKRIIGRKNGNAYDVYLDDNLFFLIEEIYEHYSNMDGFSNEAYVFPSEQYGFDKPLGDHTPTRWVEQLATYTGLHNPTFHGLRHSFCSYATSVCGLTPYEVADKLGDTVQVVLSTYHDFFNDQKIETANRINKYSHNLSFLLNKNKEKTS